METIMEIMEQVHKLQAQGYKLADKGTLQEPIEAASIAPYSGEFGTGYILKDHYTGYPASYCRYEIYVKDGGEADEH
jgi:hypothetical protein